MNGRACCLPDGIHLKVIRPHSMRGPLRRPILWKRKDGSGFESSRVALPGSDWRVEGVAVFSFEADACRLDYGILCSSDWMTRSATITGWVGSRAIEIVIARSVDAEWTLNGQQQPAVSGCDDI